MSNSELFAAFRLAFTIDKIINKYFTFTISKMSVNKDLRKITGPKLLQLCVLCIREGPYRFEMG